MSGTTVSEVMNTKPVCTWGHSSLSEAARIMWERDCGWVPVIDHAHRVVGVITDRDICMAAYTRGMTLDTMAVAGTMSTNVFGVYADDPLETALVHMQEHRVRRLPVLDHDGSIVGLVSLSDLARRAAAHDGIARPLVLATMSAVSEPRRSDSIV
jgi:CBS domain-containing protein